MFQHGQNLFIYRETSTPWFDRTAPVSSFHELFTPKIKDGVFLDPLAVSYGVLPNFRQVQPAIRSTTLDAEKEYAGLLVLTPYWQERFADKILLLRDAGQRKVLRLGDLTRTDLNERIMGMQYLGGRLGKSDQEQLADFALVFQGKHLGDGELMLNGGSARFYLGEALRAESPILANMVERGSHLRAMRK
ncbi:MAG: hypothetical protein WA061_07330 [Microgenomates group bacterium]